MSKPDRLPFSVEYAKSGRAKCKMCKIEILKDSLRLAKVVPSPFHDGFLTNWFHPQCFFLKSKPKSTSEIANFDNIRWEDQQMIKNNIDGGGASTSSAGGSGASSSGAGKKRSKDKFKDFKIEYAKSNRSTCVACEMPILKDDLRLSKMDYDSEKAAMLGGIERWHHIECFAAVREDLEFFDGPESIPGFRVLSKVDKSKLKDLLPKISGKSGAPAAKKIKKEEIEPVDDREESAMKQQNDEMFDWRDKLTKVPNKVTKTILEYNDQHISYSFNNMLDHLIDLMTFGALAHCEKCKDGKFKFVSGVGYTCRGNISEWTKCDEILITPKRIPLKIPENLKKKYDFLADYVPKTANRIFKVSDAQSKTLVKSEDSTGPKVQRGPMPLKGMQFVIAGKTKKTKEQLTKEIMLLGGTVSSRVTPLVAAVISTEKSLEKGGATFNQAQEQDIQVITEDFIDEAKDFKNTPITLITKKTISSWGSDPSVRVNNSIAKSMSSLARSGKSMYEKSMGKVKLKVKSGGTVDPESGLEEVAHIYQSNGTKYNATLGLTDVQSGRNSYYKMQILEHDKRKRYHLFRSWGRIGTTIGRKQTDEMSLEACIDKFCEVYLDKTGNHWDNRNNFIKRPGCMYPMDVDECDGDDNIGNFESEINSSLKKPIQDLIKLIFDVKTMKKVMAEYEIDTDKLPLGKLSKKQLQSAYSVLNEALQIIKSDNPQHLLIVDATNRFYTLVPHSFGRENPPLLDNEALINLKCQMIDSLMEMEIAYNLLNIGSDKNSNPVDSYYKKLNTDIDVLDKNSEEFKMIEQYTKNTHAETHRTYELQIEEVFVVKRQNEDKRFKPFKKLPNRKLLWHGSRVTNFGGILSQGLRIAPPEAPATGYMFGKGIYFADMVSKSANYCVTSSQNPTGLLLLCEVALGNMYTRLEADYIEKLPKGKHSTFGMGQTCPDPNVKHVTPDGAEVPYGPAVKQQLPGKSSLLYNEFIVYDVAQVKVQYLVRMNFKHKL